MKNTRWIIALMLIVGYGAAFGQSQPTKASIMEDAFGAIRADMVRDACEILGYKDQEVIGKITNESIDSFCNEIETRKKDSKKLKNLRNIIGDARMNNASVLSGDDISIYKSKMDKFRSQLKAAFTETRIQDALSDDESDISIENRISSATTLAERYFGEKGSYADEIKKLVEECECFNRDMNEYEIKYSQGLFIDVVADSSSTKKNYQQNSKFPSKAIEKPNQNSAKPQEKGEDNIAKREDSPSQVQNANVGDKKQVDGKDTIINTVESNDDKTVQHEEKPTTTQLNQTNEIKQEEGIETAQHQDSEVDSNSNNLIWILIAGIAIAALILAFILSKRKKSQSQPVSDDKELREENAAFERCSTVSACDYYLNTYPSGRFVKEVIAKKEGLLDKMQKEEDEAFKACTTITACDYYLIKYPQGRYVNEVKEKKIKLTEGGNNPKPKPEPENKPKPEPKQKQGEWVVVGASVKGNGHIQSNMPCQDNHKFELLGKGWGIAVVSDGAGSAAHSELGSKVVVERGAVHFKSLIEKEGWIGKNALPSDAEWLQKSYFVLKTIRNEVEMVAKKNNVELKSLSATCLAVVFSPLGLLAVHVGDGRMGCKTASGGWKAIMTPHKGEEANQTLFLVSDFWDIPNYVQSGVLVPESIVVREPVEAFAVMSDGCESTAWLCTAKNAETGKYYDQNKPFEGFFNPLEETMASFHQDNVPEKERQEKWYKFIESGTKGFVKEQDDKTMVLGVFL